LGDSKVDDWEQEAADQQESHEQRRREQLK
jgi:hypothetical protein